VLLAVLGPVGAQAVTESKVLLLRHCPRAPYPTDRYPPLSPYNKYTQQDNFSARAFPSFAQWGAKAGMCTPNGLKLARQIGAALPAILGSEQAAPRCKDSAAALGVNSSDVQVDQALFDPLNANLPKCSQPDWHGTLAAEVQKAREKLQGARKLLPKLQTILGRGRAPPLDEIPDVVNGGHYVGGLRVASESIVETFELERTSSIPTAWGELSDAELRELLQLRSTYFAVTYGGRDITQRYASGVFAKLLEKSLPPATVLIGHDLNLQAVRSLLGIEWQCGMWAANALTPLSGIMFTLSENSVRIQYVCPTLTDSEPLVLGEASFAGGEREMPISQFSSLLRSAIEWDCVKSSRAESENVVFA